MRPSLAQALSVPPQINPVNGPGRRCGVSDVRYPTFRTTVAEGEWPSRRTVARLDPVLLYQIS